MSWLRRPKPEPTPEDGIPPDRLTPLVAELDNLTDRFRLLVERSQADAARSEEERHRDDE